MRVFLSFIGLGAAIRDPSRPSIIVDHAYDLAAYEFPGHAPSPPTRYVQRAIIDALVANGEPPELVLIGMTPGSREWQWDKPGRLRDGLLEIEALRPDGRIEPVGMSEDLSVESQWATFQAILQRVPHGCDLYVDLTHGFRAVPILFSVAIHFLTQAKQVNLAGAFYGAYEPRKPGPFPIVDMRGFFAVNRWAEAVRSVIEDANPSQMAALAKQDPSLEFNGLRDEGLISGLERLGSVLKNADTRSVAETADAVIAAIERAVREANPASSVLLELALEKFQHLARESGARRFTQDWYEVQLQMAKILLDHGLAMQGLTVLRELVVSWGEEVAMRALRDPDNVTRKAYLDTHSWSKFKGTWIKSVRQRLAEKFYARLHVEERDWKPRDRTYDQDGSRARGFLDAEFERGFAERKRGGQFAFLKELGDLRNGLNHGWTTRKAEHEAIYARAHEHFEQIARITRELMEEGILGLGDSE